MLFGSPTQLPVFLPVSFLAGAHHRISASLPFTSACCQPHGPGLLTAKQINACCHKGCLRHCMPKLTQPFASYLSAKALVPACRRRARQ